MTSTFLSAGPFRSDSQERGTKVNQPSNTDDYDYEDVVDVEGELTKELPASNQVSLPIEGQELFDLAVSTHQEDPDLAYTETHPNIWQRHQGGWSARIPDVEGEKFRSRNAPWQIQNQFEKRRTEERLPKEIECCLHMSISLHWDIDHAQKQRKLLIRSANPTEEVFGVAPRKSVTWRHYKHLSLSLTDLKGLAKDCESKELTDSDVRLIFRLVKRLQTMAERSFAGGKYLIPLALRYDNQDISKYTIDKTCIFFSFPYFQIAEPSFRRYFGKDYPGHPPRTILQSRYRLNRTIDRDRYQCIRLLNNATLDSCMTPEGRNAHKKRPTNMLVYIPQLWGLITGPDNLISYGCLDKGSLWDSAIDDQNGSSLWPIRGRLSFVRIFFDYENRIEDLTYPLGQCNSWFGLLNKQQQILGFVEPGKDKAGSTDYNFWTAARDIARIENERDGSRQPFRNERRILTPNNWKSLLKDSQSEEVLEILLKKNSTLRKGIPSIKVDFHEDNQASTSSLTKRKPADALTKFKIQDIIRPFFAWPIVDEAGDRDEKLELPDRVSKFLHAIYLELPVKKKMTNEEQSDRPGQAITQRIDGKKITTIHPKTLAQIQETFISAKTRRDVMEMYDNFLIILGLFLPGEYVDRDCSSASIQLYWGFVYEIFQETVNIHHTDSALCHFSRLVVQIINSAWRLHQGVYCTHYEHTPRNDWWFPKEDISKSATLLSAIVDAFGSIFLMLIAEVEYLRRTNPPNQLEPEGESKVAKYGSEALKSLKNARNQLIRGADGRNGNDIIGPVLTPEAIVITLIERLALGVCGSGKIDIILMYEECLEKLALQVKHEASRRLLQTINELQEEVAIVDSVLKQQRNVLYQFRSALDPISFRTPSTARKLRYRYEQRNIDRVLSIIKEHIRSCSELRERAANLSTQNVQLVETLQDDNSKAVITFTMVTVLFLPPSFVAGFFGMNFDSITKTNYTVMHFWAIALPFTIGVIILCTVVGFKGEETYFLVTRLGRTARTLFRHEE